MRNKMRNKVHYLVNYYTKTTGSQFRVETIEEARALAERKGNYKACQQIDIIKVTRTGLTTTNSRLVGGSVVSRLNE